MSKDKSGPAYYTSTAGDQIRTCKLEPGEELQTGWSKTRVAPGDILHIGAPFATYVMLSFAPRRMQTS